MRVLITTSCCFWISRKAVERARQLGALWASPSYLALVGEPDHFSSDDPDAGVEDEDMYSLPNGVPRHDPILLRVFDELGSERMLGKESELEEILCLTIPDDVVYYVASYIGEWIAEQHRCWDGKSLSGDESSASAFSINSRFSDYIEKVGVSS